MADHRLMHEKAVLHVVTKFLLAPIMLFALYVQFHGDFGPGGGFQAGVIFASAFILYAVIFGIGAARRVVPAWLTRWTLAVGVLIYAGTGMASLFLGGNFLDYSVLGATPVAGQHLGIMVIEFGVGTTVAAAMITIFYVYSRHDRRNPARDRSKTGPGDRIGAAGADGAGDGAP